MLVYDLKKNMDNNQVNIQEDVLVQIAKQTTDCCYFIRSYASDTSFGERFKITYILFVTCCSMYDLVKRMALNTFSNVDQRIESYCGTFGKLKQAFDDKIRVETRIVVTRILGEVEHIGEYLRYLRDVY